MGAAVAVVLFAAWKPSARWWAARGWSEAPAVVRSARLENRPVGDRQWVVEVVADYDYFYGDTRSHGTQVLLPGAGVLDRRDAQKHAELEALIEAGGETVCFVNPEKPGESLLDRSLRYEDLLVLLAVGGAFFGAGWMLFARAGEPVLGSGRRSSRGERLGLATMMVGFNAVPWLLLAYSTQTRVWVYASALGVGLITLWIAQSEVAASRRTARD